VAEKESNAEIDHGIGDLRFARDVSEGKKAATLEAVRSRRAILSAEQTLTKLTRRKPSSTEPAQERRSGRWATESGASSPSEALTSSAKVWLYAEAPA
jgi:hypothetical protein